MVSEVSGIEIKGMYTTFPQNQVHNEDYADIFGEKEVRKQIKVTGITSRYCIKEPQLPSDLCIHAAKHLMADTVTEADNIKILVYVTAYTDYVIPPTSAYIKAELGIADDCISYDVNLGCSSFINGAYIISTFLERMPKGTQGLLLISDTVNYGGEGYDKSTSMLSSDCGTATLFENTKTDKKIVFQQKADGSRYESLVRMDLQHNLQMDGMAVFQFTISDVVDTIKEFMEKTELTGEDMDYCVLHQAQKFIVDKVVAFSGLPKEKNLISYDKCGNSGGSSIPVTLCYNCEELKKQASANIFASGFGSGLAWGIMYFELPTAYIHEVEYTDCHYGRGTVTE